MKAIVYDRYGPPEVATMRDVPRPEFGPEDVLVEVRTSTVTTADWRIRAAAFPGITWLPGRLMFGLFRPRNKILGVEFSGRVAAVGDKVTEFAPGDEVFGFSGKGAHAEFVSLPAAGAIVKRPEGLRSDEAAALPFGTTSALVFLRNFGKLQTGAKVLVVGASGNVGSYAVQIAKAMGAHVTGVASGANADLVRALGASAVIDYRAQDIAEAGDDFDLVFDTVGALDFSQAKRVLGPNGVFLPLNFGLREALQALWTSIRRGRRVAIGVSGDNKADLEAVLDLWRDGKLRPVIDRQFAFADIAGAYRYVEARHRKGSVILDLSKPDIHLRVAS